MKKFIIILILALILGLLYWYSDALTFWPSKECPAGEALDSELGRCARVVADAPSEGDDEMPPFDMAEITRVTFTLDTEAGETIGIELIRNETDKQFTDEAEDMPGEVSISLLEDYVVYHNKDEDVFIPYIANYGGSGFFVSVGLFSRKEETTLILEDSYVLGDRVLVDEITLDEITIPYSMRARFRDRRSYEPMSTVPTVPKEVTSTVSNHRFGAGQIRVITSTTYRNLITIHSPMPGESVTSPLTVTGKARGTWFFEASFPIVVVDWDGRIIGKGYAQAQDEWMTESYVPFAGAISFTVPKDTPYRRGAIIFKKDNPSGLPEHDDAFEIPVLFP